MDILDALDEIRNALITRATNKRCGRGLSRWLKALASDMVDVRNTLWARHTDAYLDPLEDGRTYTVQTALDKLHGELLRLPSAYYADLIRMASLIAVISERAKVRGDKTMRLRVGKDEYFIFWHEGTATTFTQSDGTTFRGWMRQPYIDVYKTVPYTPSLGEPAVMLRKVTGEVETLVLRLSALPPDIIDPPDRP
jgi:hypothetical protein